MCKISSLGWGKKGLNEKIKEKKKETNCGCAINLTFLYCSSGNNNSPACFKQREITLIRKCGWPV